MSSDSSDSEGHRKPRRDRLDYGSDGETPSSPKESRGPKTPPRSPSGSPGNPRSPSGSPSGPRSPANPRSPSGSPANPRSPSGSPGKSRPSNPRSPSGSPVKTRPGNPRSSPGNPRSPSSSPTPRKSGRRSPSRSVSRSASRSVSPAPKRGPRSPPDNLDDDGRSNISSGSSILSQESNKREQNGEVGKKSPPAKSHFSVPNADDLSDVSDIDDSDGLADEDEVKSNKSEEILRRKPEPETRRSPPEVLKRVEKADLRGKRDSIHMDDGEQLDFEADDQPEGEKEDGEVDAPVEKNERKREKEKEKERERDREREEGEEKSGDDGEVKEDGAESLEEGEVSDEGDPKPEKPPICRFYSRGACTWGSNCRFLHPGVTDKGNYSMFDVARPMVASSNGMGMYPPEPRPYHLLPPVRALPGPYGPVARREEPAGVESAWERGLRQAKELMRKSTKRKETDMDFEEKKMNLSIGQDEMDKENDYYTRVASPLAEEIWPTRTSPKLDTETRRPPRIVERYEDIVPEPMSPVMYDRYEYRREKVRDPEFMMRREKKYYTEEEMLARKGGGKKMVREVIVKRMERPSSKRQEAPESSRRPDEWQDPWMRTKSPPGRKGAHRSRKVSYSSGSSSFSGSSSRSSSNSSYSSYSRSRSRSGSRSGSGSRSPAKVRRARSPVLPLAGRSKLLEGKFKPIKSGPTGEKAVERPMLMNPPAPSPRKVKEKPLSPTAAIRKVGLNPPAPTPKARSSQKHGGKARGRKSRSSSSGSSGSSSESSHSSYSSSSSSASPQPGRAGRKGEAEDRLGLPSLKGKGLEGLKNLEPKKPTVKMVIKPLDSKKPAPVNALAGKKRPAEEPPAADASETSPGKNAGAGGKKATSRREELLKQLKAVEDAIARKRSKI